MNIITCTDHWPATDVPPRSEPPPVNGWPPITIITPSLNRASFIKIAIESVIAQNYPAVEHIVVDGQSTDGTRDILAAYRHLRVVGETDRGSHHAMNKGLALATGRIVGFLNTDDLYAPGIFHAVARRMAGGDTRLAAGRCFFFSSIGEGEPTAEAELRHVGDPRLYLAELCYATPGFNAYFFDRDLLSAMGGFDEKFDVAADRDLLIRATLAGHRAIFLSEPGYYYRRHPASRTLDRDARLGAAILTDHRMVARKLLADESLRPDARRMLRGWRAWETARLLSFYCEPGTWRKAATLMVESGAEDPVWPARLVSAAAAMKQLRHAISKR